MADEKDIVGRAWVALKHGCCADPFNATQCVMVREEPFAVAVQPLAAEILSLREQLAAVLDVADEAYRKYCGDEFNGFDEADAGVLQAARNFWLDNGGYESLAATAIAAGQHKGESHD